MDVSVDVHEGAWILGEDTRQDANIIGFVTHVNDGTQEVSIFVVESDVDTLIHNVAVVRLEDIVTLGLEPISYLGEVQNLIDMALDERNEQWFLQLCQLMKKMQGYT